MSGSANLPLPPDVHLALTATSKLVEGLREACKRLRALIFFTKLTQGPIAAQTGVKWNQLGPKWEEKIDTCSKQFLRIAEYLDPLICDSRCAVEPLESELQKVSRGVIGGAHYPDGAMFAVGFIGTIFAYDIRKTIKNRISPFTESEIVALAAQREAILDELDAAIVSEAKQLVVVRERNALLANSNSEGEQVNNELTPTQKATLVIIQAQPKGQGISGREIIAALKRKRIVITETTLRRHVIPAIKKSHRVVNHKSAGGYLISE